MSQTLLSILAHSGHVRRLTLATLISALGTWMATLALTVDIYDRTQSDLWVSLLLFSSIIPLTGVGLLFGPIIDRAPRRRLIVASEIAGCLVFVALAFSASPWQIVGLAAASAFAAGFLRPAVYAGLPNAVGSADIVGANALLSSAETIAFIAGPILGGIVVAAAGPHTCYWINAVSFLLGAVVLLRIPAAALQGAYESKERYWRALVTGLQTVRNSRVLLTVLLSWNLIMVSFAAILVSQVVLAKTVLDGGNIGFGFLMSATGVGLAIGTLSARRLTEARSPDAIYVLGLIAIGLGAGATAAAPNLWVATAFVALVGFGNAVAVVCNRTIVQVATPDEVRGRVFSVLMSSTTVVRGLSMIPLALMTDIAGARSVWGLAAAAAFLGAAVAFVRRADRASPTPIGEQA